MASRLMTLLTAGVITGSISGGIAIFDGGIGAVMHPLVPKLALRIQIDFSNPESSP